MTEHVALYKFNEDVTPEEVAEFFDEANAIAVSSGGLKHYASGKNVSIEGRHEGFTHGFTMSFESDEARKTYLWHKARIAFWDRWLPRVDKWIEMDF